MALRLLEKDRDHHRVLVDITNAVLSHLDLDDLIADVAREIHHFFGLASVSMVLGDHRKNEKFSLWCSDLSASHCACLPRNMPGDSVLLTQTLQTRQPTLTHRANDLFLWQRDPLLLLLTSLTAANLRSLYRLPLAATFTGCIVAGACYFHSL